MTSSEILDALALADWKASMKNIFDEAKPHFKACKDKINAHSKQLLADARKLQKAVRVEAVRVEAVRVKKQQGNGVALWRKEMANLAKGCKDLADANKKKAAQKEKAVQLQHWAWRQVTLPPDSSPNESDQDSFDFPPPPSPIEARPRPRPCPIKKVVAHADSQLGPSNLPPNPHQPLPQPVQPSLEPALTHRYLL
ncbi:hypothetical protein NLJ89_g10465 [Agrocybe chaxingu]|uniref:Uncharacterized protein n=1 Tax=Agrocybe chaxingu TaxID=84603 RepID=A0A9W8MQW4_9AGAR|nr:hypothetical protein NLJ89_g10465 [Agrocybe chaxingu]